MKRINTKKLTAFVLILLICASVCTTVVADTNYKAYAIYRFKDSSLDLHAGMLRNQSGSSVIHVSSRTPNIVYTTIDGFMGIHPDSDFVGVYKPYQSNMTDSLRAQIVQKLDELEDKNPDYCGGAQIVYDTSDMDNTRVEPEEIEEIRCDGMVEYVYEYHYIPICGPDNYWNISIKNPQNYNQRTHYGPTAQTRVMTQVQVALPN